MVAVKISFTKPVRIPLLKIYVLCYISICFVKLHENILSSNIDVCSYSLWIIPRGFFMSKKLFIHCHSKEIQHFLSHFSPSGDEKV